MGIALDSRVRVDLPWDSEFDGLEGVVKDVIEGQDPDGDPVYFQPELYVVALDGEGMGEELFEEGELEVIA